MYNPGFNFVKAPMEFNKNTDRDTLQYCLGATLYMPGTKDIREKVINHELPVTSFVMCCEDAIKEELAATIIRSELEVIGKTSIRETNQTKEADIIHIFKRIELYIDSTIAIRINTSIDILFSTTLYVE